MKCPRDLGQGIKGPGIKGPRGLDRLRGLKDPGIKVPGIKGPRETSGDKITRTKRSWSRIN